MFILKHLKTLQHVLIIFRELVCSLLVTDFKIGEVCWTAVQHTSPHRTHTHQMLCCRITTLTFYIFNKF